MNILVVEDDLFKLDKIVATLLEEWPGSDVSVCGSVQEAVVHLRNTVFDLIVLDMALPSHPIIAGDSPPTSMLSGGMEVIMELAYQNRSDAVIVLTQYPEIEIEGELLDISSAEMKLREAFGPFIRATILYDHLDSNWNTAFIKAVKSIS